MRTAIHDSSVAERNQGRREPIWARAEFAEVSDEIMQIVELLDGLNRYRFGGEAEIRAAWKRAWRGGGAKAGGRG